MKSIWAKLSLIVMVISIGGIVGTTLLSLKEMEIHLGMFMDEMRRSEEQRVTEILAERYAADKEWGEQAFITLAGLAKGMDYRLTLYDQEKKPLFRSEGPAAGLRQGVQGEVRLLPIQASGQVVGYLSMLKAERSRAAILQEHFRSAHTAALVLTIVPLTVITGMVSILIARRITLPIIRISKASREAAKGNLEVTVPLPKGEDELTELVQSFNRMVQSLRRQDELKKRLTSDISHELRTPVNTLLAQTEGMIDGVWAASPAHLEAMRSEILRLSRIVQDLDQLNRVEAVSLEVRRQVFSLSETVEEVMRAVDPAFGKEGIALAGELAPDIRMEGDPQRISQALVNLLANARKHTPAGGKVTVTLKRQGNQAMLAVKDTGAGIADKDLPHVFERFYRGDESRQRGTGGSGLGLSIVKGIVEAHGGTVQIASKLGTGTTVTVLLPIT